MINNNDDDGKANEQIGENKANIDREDSDVDDNGKDNDGEQ